MKRLLSVLCITALLLGSITGCGKEEVTLEQPYDIYETTGSLGLGTTVSAGAQEYFSKDLCVADDVSLGTDTTDSQVAEGAGTFNLATNEIVYAKNIYERLYPASTTKILTAYIALKYCTDLSQTVTISENAANQASDSSVCGLHAGDVIRRSARHDDIISRSHGVCSVYHNIHIAPVCHHSAVKSPFFPKDTGAQILTAPGENAVYLVKRRHNAGNMCFSYQHFKRLQV